jgi:hypothetical protein
MEYTTIIIGIVLLFFIILFVLLITYSVLLNKSKENSRGMGKKMPPIDYMMLEGVKCPDYWLYMGDDKSGNHICKNQYNIPIANSSSSKCYSDAPNKIMKFRNANMLRSGNMDMRASKQRCDFVSTCGPTTNSTASWLGINSDNASMGWVNCGKV